MRTYLCLPAMLLLFTACSTKFVRTGYSLKGHTNDIPFCTGGPLPIKDNYTFIKENTIILGSISADCRLSFKCNEETVLHQFEKEACLLGANVINIRKEHQPTFWSNKYSVEADFLDFKESPAAAMQTDQKYDPTLVKKRSVSQVAKKKSALLNGIIAGAIVGLTLGR